MAVEIKELVFKMIVTDSNEVRETRNGEESVSSEQELQKIIRASVKEVLRILERQKTR